MEWQHIDTVPKDGSWKMFYVPIENHRMFMGIYSKQGILLNERLIPAPWPPTHWMPLPEPPQANEE